MSNRDPYSDYFENPQKNNTTLHEIPTGDNLGNPHSMGAVSLFRKRYACHKPLCFQCKL